MWPSYVWRFCDGMSPDPVLWYFKKCIDQPCSWYHVCYIFCIVCEKNYSSIKAVRFSVNFYNLLSKTRKTDRVSELLINENCWVWWSLLQCYFVTLLWHTKQQFTLTLYWNMNIEMLSMNLGTLFKKACAMCRFSHDLGCFALWFTNELCISSTLLDFMPYIKLELSDLVFQPPVKLTLMSDFVISD